MQVFLTSVRASIGCYDDFGFPGLFNILDVNSMKSKEECRFFSLNFNKEKEGIFWQGDLLILINKKSKKRDTERIKRYVFFMRE